MDMICGKYKKNRWLFISSLTHFVNDIETTLGISIQSQNEENSEFLHKAHYILDITARRFFQPWIQPAFLFRLSKFAKPFYSSVNYLNKLLIDVSSH